MRIGTTSVWQFGDFMKIHPLRIGALALGLIGSAATARASFVANNPGDNCSISTEHGAILLAEGFSTGQDASVISRIILGLNCIGTETSANLHPQVVNGTGQPLTAVSQIGTASSKLNRLAGDPYSVTPDSTFAAEHPLSSSQNYEIAFNNPGASGVEWGYTTPPGANTGDGTFLDAWNYRSGQFNSGSNVQLQHLGVKTVPEPAAQACLVFGSMAALSFIARRLRNQFITHGNSTQR